MNAFEAFLNGCIEKKSKLIEAISLDTLTFRVI